MLTEIVDKVNTIINKVNKSFNAKKALSSNEITITFYYENQFLCCFVFFNESSNFTIRSQKSELMVIENLISIIHKIHLLNSHLSFYVNEYDCNVLQLKSNILLLPMMNDVIKSFELIFQQPIEEDQRILEHYIIKDKLSLELIIIYHTYLSIGAFDLMIFNNRQINHKAMNDILMNKRLLMIMRKDYGFIIEGGQLSILPKRNLPKNFSIVILANMISEVNNEKEEEYDNTIIDTICDCLEKKADEFYGKIRNYVSNININMNFHIIKQSLLDVYHLTHNNVLYEKMKLLLDNDKISFETKLFNSFIQGRYNHKEEEENKGEDEDDNNTID